MKKFLSIFLLLACVLTLSYAQADAQMEIQDPLSFFGEDMTRCFEQESRRNYYVLNFHALSKSGGYELTKCYTDYLDQLDSVELIGVYESQSSLAGLYYCYAPAKGYDLQTFTYGFRGTDGNVIEPPVCLQIEHHQNSITFQFSHSFKLADHGVRVEPELAAYLKDIAGDEEQERIKEMQEYWGKTTTQDSDGNCDVCDGTGECPECGGDMWVTEWDWVYEGGSPESRLVTKLCDGVWCYGGSCLKCRGDK